KASASARPACIMFGSRAAPIARFSTFPSRRMTPPGSATNIPSAPEPAGSLEIPEERNDDHGDEPHDKVHRDPDFEEIPEAVAAGRIDEGVGLIADRGCKARRGGEHHRDDEGARIEPEGGGKTDHDRCHDGGDGVVG